MGTRIPNKPPNAGGETKPSAPTSCRQLSDEGRVRPCPRTVLGIGSQTHHRADRNGQSQCFRSTSLLPGPTMHCLSLTGVGLRYKIPPDKVSWRWFVIMLRRPQNDRSRREGHRRPSKPTKVCSEWPMRSGGHSPQYALRNAGTGCCRATMPRALPPFRRPPAGKSRPGDGGNENPGWCYLSGLSAGVPRADNPDSPRNPCGDLTQQRTTTTRLPADPRVSVQRRGIFRGNRGPLSTSSGSHL